uniref:Btb poz domain containing protein n=1 Tax=Tetraselmis sp. GSL018 TaxID=582737 RepID=A0A061RPG4_9CHLO
MRLKLRQQSPRASRVSMFIAGGTFVGEDVHGAKAYWDSLLVTPRVPGTYTDVDEEEEPVLFDEAHQWELVDSTIQPPARHGHTAVIFADGMYVFGGERAAYEYSDLWKFVIPKNSWQFIAPRNSSSDLGRHDHSAVVYNRTMYVYGGRSPRARSDFWAYDFDEGTWSPLPTCDAMDARFGHSAAVVDGRMYVFGGFKVGAVRCSREPSQTRFGRLISRTRTGQRLGPALTTSGRGVIRLTLSALMMLSCSPKRFRWRGSRLLLFGTSTAIPST